MKNKKEEEEQEDLAVSDPAILDFCFPERTTEALRARMHRLDIDGALQEHSPTHPAVSHAYRVDGLDGFVFIPNPFTETEQRFWTKRSVTQLCCGTPTNISNLEVMKSGGEGSTQAAEEEEKVFWKEDSWDPSLMANLKWATLGYRFYWSERCYKTARFPFPPDLALLTRHLSSKVPPLPRGDSVATEGWVVNAEAAIVNYYHSHRGAMGGHVDNSEQDMSKPIVSLSFGNEAIFLMGGRTTETAPLAMRVRSGDVVIMGGETRLCYHGVPRIIEGSAPAFLLEANEDEGYPKDVATYIQSARVNINIRQVFPSREAAPGAGEEKRDS